MTKPSDLILQNRKKKKLLKMQRKLNGFAVDEEREDDEKPTSTQAKAGTDSEGVTFPLYCVDMITNSSLLEKDSTARTAMESNDGPLADPSSWDTNDEESKAPMVNTNKGSNGSPLTDASLQNAERERTRRVASPRHAPKETKNRC